MQRCFHNSLIKYFPSFHTQQNKYILEKTQNRAARWVKGNYSPYESVTQMKQELGWRTLEDRRADTRLILFYKIIHGLVALPTPIYLQHPTRLTRHMHPLSYLQIHTSVNYYKYSFFPATIILWNRLPTNIVMLTDLDQFKQAVCSYTY